MNLQTQLAVDAFLARGGEIKELKPSKRKTDVKWGKILKDQKVKETENEK